MKILIESIDNDIINNSTFEKLDYVIGDSTVGFVVVLKDVKLHGELLFPGGVQSKSMKEIRDIIRDKMSIEQLRKG